MKDVADFWLRKAKKHTDDSHLQSFCLDKAITFMVGDTNIKNASNWILENKVTIDGTEISIKLSAQQKYIIVKKYWASSEFS